MNKPISILFIFASLFSIQAQDTLNVKKNNILNTQTLLSVNTESQPSDSSQFKTPKYKQGFFCDFEDQMNRKKVPIDFSLGNSKY